MNANPLEPIWKTYQISVKCFDLTYDIIKQKKTSLLTNSDWLLVPNIQQDIVQTRQESNDLFIVSLWATFESFVISYLQDKGTVLQQHVVPTALANALYEQFKRKVEDWKTDDILNLLKEIPSIDENLIGPAKTIFQYKNWITNGKDINKASAICVVSTADSYYILNEIVSILLLN
jgi:hypothetical protein